MRTLQFFPLNLQSHRDKSGTVFGVAHALSCGTGGLVIAHHTKIHDKLLYLSLQAFTPTSVRAKHLIHQGCTISDK